ncbi:MAG: D-alanine--D-alanine ligase [Alphaproteobacteria bacterium]
MPSPKKTHVAVLMGGWSAEREISLISGTKCAEALNRAGFKVEPIDVKRNIAEVLTKLKPDVAFNALHGRWGEDGCVQGLLEILAIPYTHSGVLASSLAMDKERAKIAFRDVGIPCAQSKVINRHRVAEAGIPAPYVVKPVSEGSSVGVYLVRQGDNRPPEILTSDKWTLGEEVMVEEFIPGRELTVAVQGDRALAVTEIFNNVGDFYDYEAKYAKGGSTHVIPADVPKKIFDAAMDYALKAHQVLGCRGVSRTDFRYDDTKGAPGRLIILETNTQPGMTPTSLVPEQAQHCKMSFDELVSWMVEDASLQR